MSRLTISALSFYVIDKNEHAKLKELKEIVKNPLWLPSLEQKYKARALHITMYHQQRRGMKVV
jgi:hypothetical protein